MDGCGLWGCVLLWGLVMAMSLARGEVITPASLNAVVGLPITMSCNVTMKTGDTVKQVRWLTQSDHVLVAYKPGEPNKIYSQDRGVTLAATHKDVSVITMENTRQIDEGCYRCIFDIFPSGAQEGTTCLKVIVKVVLEGNKTAVSGKLASLSCQYGLPENVHQVLWRKTVEHSDSSSVASYAKRGQPIVEGPFVGRMTLSQSLGDTQLIIRPVMIEDEGCYTCEFHTYPEGTRSATACLSVYVLPKPEVTYAKTSPGVIEANCTARSRPPPAMVWNVERDNRTLGQPVSSFYDQGDGTTLVTSTLLLRASLLDVLSVKCMVHHPGFDTPMSVSLNTKVGPALATLIAVSCVAVLLLLCLCVCICKCFFCRGD